MINMNDINQLTQKITDALPKGLDDSLADIKKNIHSILQDTLTEFDQVSRDEFDAQVRVLHRLRERIEALEKQLAHQ